METIVVCSRKGGSGKTTLTRNLAVLLVQKGFKVLLVDTDSQGNLTDWWKARESEDIDMVVLNQLALRSSLVQLRKIYDYVLIDTPPEANSNITHIIEVADFAFITVKASPDDLRSVGITVDLLKQKHVPYAFVMSEVDTRLNITKQAESTLRDLGNVAGMMRNLVQHRETSINGLTPLDSSKSGKAARDVNRIADNLITYLTLRGQSK